MLIKELVELLAKENQDAIIKIQDTKSDGVVWLNPQVKLGYPAVGITESESGVVVLQPGE